ncbi:DUF3810 domain-containing protein [Prolixibacteraceae bacterium Z1-6]|uniref:DUF3810 domain-containing protein n=1 Tax=Draconibacterium aestuarii TaxID=2998507 RepID=A0A9X3J6N0_9BACT|nr:DUF3810 domain-containing protein [Prolixibacteraceae bacterium Z1-6]
MQKKTWKIRFKKWLRLPALAILCFLITEVFSQNPDFVERSYSQFFYPFVARIFSGITSWFPFSLDDIFYLLLIGSIPVLIFLLFTRKISMKYAGKLILNTLSAVYILFYVLWGFNYYRPPLNERLELEEKQPDKEAFITVINKLIEDTNNSHCSFGRSEYNLIENSIENSYKNLAPLVKIPYPMGIRNDKKITLSNFFAQTGIAGYFGPFFNEIHVNKKVLPLEYPFVLAHEKAHQFGITSEAEANFYAWLVCTTSDSQQVRYSANLAILRHFLIRAYQMEEFSELIAKINPHVKNDINAIREHWLELRNEKLDKAASKVNDAYLKTNKVKEGVKDYRGVVKHVMNFSLDSVFQEKYNLANH